MPIESFKEQLELTAVIGCKSQCKYCPQDIFVRRYFETGDVSFKPKELTLENCKNYLSTVPGDLRISLAGFSEPLSIDGIVDIYKWLVGGGRLVEVHTSLYNVKKDTLKGIMDVGIDFIQLHIPDKYALTKIELNLEYKNKLRYVLSHLKSTNAFIVVTCLGDPPDELAEIISKYDNITAKNIGNLYINDRAGLIQNGTAFKSQYYPGRIHCCKSIKSLNNTVLLPDGSLALCCMDFGLDNVLGNLRHNTYSEILNGEKANEIRRKMDAEGEDFICRHCEFAVPLQQD